MCAPARNDRASLCALHGADPRFPQTNFNPCRVAAHHNYSLFIIHFSFLPRPLRRGDSRIARRPAPRSNKRAVEDTSPYAVNKRPPCHAPWISIRRRRRHHNYSFFIIHFSLPFPVPSGTQKRPEPKLEAFSSSIPFFPLISAAPRSCAGSPRPWASRPDRPPPAPAGWAGCGWNPGS